MNVFTVYFHGSGVGRISNNNHNLIHHFSESTISAAPNACAIINGPNKFGTDCDVRVNEALIEISRFLDRANDDDPIIVNLCGFSRGAINCMRVASEVSHRAKDRSYKHYNPKWNNVVFNMLLIDPVADPIAKSKPDAGIIPDNVQECLVFVVLDEYRYLYDAQDITRFQIADHSKTLFHILPMPGQHQSCTRAMALIKFKDGTIDKLPALITWYFAHQRLTNWGTVFQANKIPDFRIHHRERLADGSPKKESIPYDPSINEKTIIEFFQDLKTPASRAAYAEAGKNYPDDKYTPHSQRRLNSELQRYTQGHDVFLNQYERELVNRYYPNVFYQLFSSNIIESNLIDNACIANELNAMKVENSKLYSFLKSLGLITPDDKLVAYQGVHAEEKMRLLNRTHMKAHEFDYLKAQVLQSLYLCESDMVLSGSITEGLISRVIDICNAKKTDENKASDLTKLVRDVFQKLDSKSVLSIEEKRIYHCLMGLPLSLLKPNSAKQSSNSAYNGPTFFSGITRVYDQNRMIVGALHVCFQDENANHFTFLLRDDPRPRKNPIDNLLKRTFHSNIQLGPFKLPGGAARAHDLKQLTMEPFYDERYNTVSQVVALRKFTDEFGIDLKPLIPVGAKLHCLKIKSSFDPNHGDSIIYFYGLHLGKLSEQQCKALEAQMKPGVYSAVISKVNVTTLQNRDGKYFVQPGDPNYSLCHVDQRGLAQTSHEGKTVSVAKNPAPVEIDSHDMEIILQSFNQFNITMAATSSASRENDDPDLDSDELLQAKVTTR